MSFKAEKISENVYWVGAIDWEIRDFHGYETSRGTTYNAYLIIDEKITLIDTVKEPFKNEMLSRISDVIDPEKIDYIVSNHAEMDHSGSLPFFIEKIRPEKFFASTMGKKALEAHFDNFSVEITPVKTGDSINLGKGNLNFIETRMLHWPDSMFSYFDTDKILFCQDAFGMHLASSERFDTQLPLSLLIHEAKKYYANILTPYSMQVNRLIKSLPDLDLDIKIFANDHGPMWTEHSNQIIEKYAEWSEQKTNDRAIIVFDTMWKSTEKMARIIADGIISKGVKTKVMPLSACHRSNVATELLTAGAFILGSPTINNGMFPRVSDMLCYVKGLKFKNFIVQSFGSYGWSGEACKHINEEFEKMKYEFVGNPIKANYIPTDEDYKKCFELGEMIGEKLRNSN